MEQDIVEFEEEHPSLLSYLFIPICALSILADILITWVVVKYPKMHTRSNLALINHTINFGVYLAITLAVAIGRDGLFSCDVGNMDDAFYLATVFTMMVLLSDVLVERYLKISLLSIYLVLASLYIICTTLCRYEYQPGNIFATVEIIATIGLCSLFALKVGHKFWSKLYDHDQNLRLTIVGIYVFNDTVIMLLLRYTAGLIENVYFELLLNIGNLTSFFIAAFLFWADADFRTCFKDVLKCRKGQEDNCVILQ